MQCALQGWCAGIATALEFSFTGVQGCLVDFVLREVLLQDRVLEGSGTVVSLLSNFIPVSSCSWSPLEQLILLLAALEFWHISN